MRRKNIRPPTEESRAAVSIIRGAESSWQREQTRLTFGRKIGNSIAAPALAPRLSFLTAEAAALYNQPARYRIGRQICSLKIEFNFLNGYLLRSAKTHGLQSHRPHANQPK